MNQYQNINQNDELVEGIVLKTTDYKENSKLVFILCSFGLLSLEAKGANKPNSKNNNYTLPLTKISFHHTKTHLLTTGKVIDNYNNIKLEIDKYLMVSPIIELTLVLAEHITNYELFYSFLNDILNKMNQNNEKEFDYLYLLTFKTKYLYLLGIAPVLSKCVDCGETKALVGFDLTDGGMKCKHCVSNFKSLNTSHYIELFRTLYLKKIEEIDFKDLVSSYTLEERKALNQFLSDYYETYLGFVSKANKIIDDIK